METVKLGDVCEIQSGGTPSRANSDFWANGTIPWVKISDFDGKYLRKTQEYISQKGFEHSSAKMFEKGTILYSIFATLGETCILDINATTNQAIAGIKIVDERIEQDYLYHFLCSKKAYVNALGRGVAQNNINLKILKAFEIPVLSMAQQKKIAYQFDKVSDLIEKQKKQLEKLEELVKARFVEMFENKHFEMIPFGEVSEFLRNGANIKQAKDSGGYPITRIETLSNSIFNVERLGYAGITDLQKYEKYILRKGDILISHINSVAYLGRAVQYKGELETPIIHGVNLLCARIKKTFNATYIEWFFKTPMAKKYIASITKKAVNQASITTSDLKKMFVPSPPLELQNQFAAFVKQTDKSKAEIQKSLDKLEILKKSLMQKYFG